MYTKEDLTPENDNEEMLVMAVLRKCRGQRLYVMSEGTAITSLNTCTVRIDVEYRKPAPKKLNIPWEFIKDEFTCAAMDQGGSVWVYSDVPPINTDTWGNTKECELVTAALKIEITGIEWKESLTFRLGEQRDK